MIFNISETTKCNVLEALEDYADEKEFYVLFSQNVGISVYYKHIGWHRATQNQKLTFITQKGRRTEPEIH